MQIFFCVIACGPILAGVIGTPARIYIQISTEFGINKVYGKSTRSVAFENLQFACFACPERSSFLTLPEMGNKPTRLHQFQDMRRQAAA